MGTQFVSYNPESIVILVFDAIGKTTISIALWDVMTP